MTEWEKGQSGNPNGRPREWTDEKLHELGNELIQFMEEDGNWHYCMFALKKGKSDHWLHDLGNNYPLFLEYLTKARKIIGHKMFKYGMEKNPNAWMIKTFMPRYLGLEKEALNAVEKEEEAKEKGRQRAQQQKDDSVKCMFNKKMEKVENGS